MFYNRSFIPASDPEHPKVAGENLIFKRKGLWLLLAESGYIKSKIATPSAPDKDYGDLCLSGAYKAEGEGLVDEVVKTGPSQRSRSQ